MLQMSGMMMNRVPDVTERRVKPVLPPEVRRCSPFFLKLGLRYERALRIQLQELFWGTVSRCRDLESNPQPLCLWRFPLSPA